jgi:hypothetical protein
MPLTHKTWRDHARPIIASVIKEFGHDPKLLKAKLREAYPFYERKYHPYKVWCDEVRRQLGTKRFKLQCKPDDPNQTVMF